MTKVDRALEIQVIDWLQWYEFPANMPQLALELLHKRQLRNKELTMIIRRMNRMAGRMDREGCLAIQELYLKAEHLLEPGEIMRDQAGSDGTD